VADAEHLQGRGNRLPSRHLHWTLLILLFIENLIQQEHQNEESPPRPPVRT
jgi:hypothetical protein